MKFALSALLLASQAAAYDIIHASSLNCRAKPSSSSKLVKVYQMGEDVDILCQIKGQAIRGNSVWDYTQDECYVADFYLQTGFSSMFKDLCEDSSASSGTSKSSSTTKSTGTSSSTNTSGNSSSSSSSEEGGDSEDSEDDSAKTSDENEDEKTSSEKSSETKGAESDNDNGNEGGQQSAEQSDGEVTESEESSLDDDEIHSATFDSKSSSASALRSFVSGSAAIAVIAMTFF
ncbi:hypothetical protein FB645_005616 [Coemansia sp. IMI 203386]|nr:hypothetical protein FB645_005616 [Coemansia sp. IMI 203386]